MMEEEAFQSAEVTSSSDEPDPIHIEVNPANPDGMIATMYCGATCVLDAEGNPIPYMDWFAGCAGHKATCAPCKAAWRAAGSPDDALWIRT